MSQTLIVETRRSKGVHKADLTKFTKEDVKTALDYFQANSYVAVRNYRSKSEDNEVIEIKFHRVGTKGNVKYCLKTILSKDDLKAIGFVDTPNKNLHLTAAGSTLDTYFDVEVKEPAKKISSKKEKKEKAEKASVKKTPLAHPSSKSKIAEGKAVEDEEDTKKAAPKKTPLAAVK